ncbi:MAG: tetratricopeptide repeat protein [Thermoguttaceae bacterium]|jgi:uncharacterized protein YfaS (alpha-2-macroglobulin family)/TolA-binding protein|nr:tetratricopeptide repeat protein [Thermoguttaceae bacterium]
MRCARLVPAVVLSLLLSLAPASAVDHPAVDVQVQQLMQARDYAAAVAAIDPLLQQEGAPKDYLAYLKGRALALAKKYDEAAAVLAAIGEQSPDSPWARKGRFAAAAALVAKGDFARAEAIYRAEAESLLSVERKQEVAGIYLEFADPLFDPPKESDEPDYAAAEELYRKALDLGLAPEKQMEVELRVARCLLEQGGESALDGAVAAYTAFIGENPGSAHDVEARFRLGECRLAQGELAKARQVWRELLAEYPEADSPQVAEAAFRLAETWRIPEPQSKRELVHGVAALRRFVERYPEHDLAAKAHLRIAKSYAHRAEYEAAVEALVSFLADPRYEKAEEIADARNLLGRVYLEQDKYDEAAAAWREFLVRHPADPAWSTVQKAIVDTDYTQALTAYEAERYEEAAALWTEFLARYPLDARSARILFLLGEIDAKGEEWEAAVATWRRLASKYPDSPEARRARLAVAATLEEKLGRLEEALEEYRKLAESRSYEPEVVQAQGAVVRLTSPSLTLTTERVYRSTEKPAVKLSTRNIKSVSVRVYRVDLEDYFRKMHTSDRIGSLDIALIDPDATFIYEVPEYAKYRHFDNAVEVPLPAGQTAGVLAVTVSSKTQEATTLVLQSDLDVIVKSSRDELFVFAANMVAGAPWPGARLLVSDGTKVFAEVTTDEQGVFQGTFDELKGADGLQILATHGTNMATSGLEIAELQPIQKLADRGYLATDRPVYRPGQTVCVRGVLRHAADQAFHFEPGESYTFEVYDPQDRRLWHEPVALGELGSFHTRFSLPEICPSGQYLLRVEDAQGRQFTRQFAVELLEKSPIRLEIDVPRTVYYQGETIEGTIRAATSYGVPLAGREVRYRLAGELEQTATTDDRGEVRFRLATDEFCETGTLSLSAGLADGHIAEVTLHLSVEGFTVDVRTTRAVYMAGEKFQVDLVTRDAQLQPIGTKLILSVLKPAKDGNSKELVEQHELHSDAAGEAAQELAIESGGSYVLRAEATDRFDNKIVAERNVWISDDSDDTRLRILADLTRYKSGDTAEVIILWHEAPALALFTCEGSQVLSYQFGQLQTGENRVRIPVGPQLAPNFHFAVAVMTDVRAPGRNEADTHFFMAAEAFEVRHELEVTLAVARADSAAGPFQPRESLEVTVTTADPQGRPLPAEVGLALVDARFRTEAGAIQPTPREIFRRQRRSLAMQTTTSIAFHYEPGTTAIGFWLADEGDDSAVEEEEVPREYSQWSGNRERAPGSLETILNAPRQQQQLQGGGFFQFGSGVTDAARPAVDAMADDPFADERSEQQSRIAQAETARVPTAAIEFAETGYWNPTIRTGEDGRATVTIVLPPCLATWQLIAQAVTADTLSGEAEQEIATRKDLHAELRLPEAFAEGDTAVIPVAIHNNVMAEGTVALTLTTTILGRTTEEKQAIEVTEKGQLDVGLPVTLKLPEGIAAAPPWFEAAFELTVTAGGRTDVVRRSVPVLPLGVPMHGTASGLATGSKAVRAGLPGDAVANRRAMQLRISPTLERALLDAILQPAEGLFARKGTGTFCRNGPPGALHKRCLSPFPVASPLEAATTNLMSAVALRKLVTPESNPSDAEALDRCIAVSLAELVASQDDAGSWTWTGHTGQADPLSTARAAWALSLAKAAGYPVPEKTLHDALGALRNAIARSEDTDYEDRAVLLHAMTTAGEGDFLLANRLHRDRAQLSPPALAYLGLTLAEMDRYEMAAEVLDLLAEKDLDQEAAPRGETGGPLRRSHSPVELRAVCLLGLQKIAPDSPRIETLAEWLLAQRSSSRWQSAGAAGPAVVALARWRKEHVAEGKPFTLAVSVNGRELKRFELEAGSPTQVVDVPSEMLAGDAPEIRFLTDAEASYAWQCLLDGCVPLDNPKAANGAKVLQKTCQPAPQVIDGRELLRGFDVLTGSYERFTNPLSQLPVEHRAVVELRFHRLTPVDGARRRPEYAVITDPIPAGARVIERSVAGPIERFEISPSGITFHVINPDRTGVIRYELVAEAEGTYRAGPTLMRHAHHMGSLLSSGGSFALEVLPRGVESADPYRFTPEELYALGKHHFARQEYRQAEMFLRELIDQWNVRPQVYGDVIRMLLDVHLAIGPVAKVVDTFEIILTRWPDTEVTFDQLLKIGAAYEAMGEMERGYLVYRGVVECNLARESAAAGFLETQGELLRSIDFMERLLREYPPEDYAASTLYSLAQHVHAKAPGAGDDPKLRQAGVDGDGLVRRSIAMFERFLTEYPEHENADRAAFSVANALLEREQYEEAAAACVRYADRYPRSKLVDSYWYILGYSRFALGQHEAAADMFRKVSEYRWTDPTTGRTEPSDNKQRAVFLLGQVFHSQGRPAEAIEQYRRVEGEFADARRSVAYFLRQQIALPELTSLKPGDAAEVKLTYRNLPSCDVKVYGIDLVKFGRLRRGFRGVDEVNLAGIRPRYEQTVALGEGLDYADRTHVLALPLVETGAYLVVCRGGNEYASGLVLVSPIETKVEHLEAEGAARVMVRDAEADCVVSGATVNVIDSATGRTVAGKTDLRGLFVAEGIAGPPTVIVKDEPSRYSLHQPPAGTMPARRMQMAQVRIAPPPDAAGVRFGVPLGRDDRARIREALAAPVAMEFIETPLQDVVDFLKDATKIEIQIDRKALDDVGLATDMPITLNVRNISLKAALRRMLRDLALTYTIEDEVLLITTPEEAENRLETRMYPVTDLVRVQDSKGEAWPDFDALIELITSTVKPQAWDEVGGPGSIAPMTVRGEEVIVLSQTQDVHDEIEELMARLRQVGQQPEDGKLPVRERPQWDGPGMGGVGGMGGGMGGMGGGFFGGVPSDDSAMPMPAPLRGDGGKAELLRGLDDAQRELQGEQADQLQRLYEKGKGGGGMGAGFF